MIEPLHSEHITHWRRRCKVSFWP